MLMCKAHPNYYMQIPVTVGKPQDLGCTRSHPGWVMFSGCACDVLIGMQDVNASAWMGLDPHVSLYCYPCHLPEAALSQIFTRGNNKYSRRQCTSSLTSLRLLSVC